MRLPVLIAALLLAGCVAFGGVEQIGENRYRVGVEATTDEAAGARAEQAALEAAADYCRAMGQRMVQSTSDTSSLDIRTTNGAISRGDNTVVFRCD